MASRAKAKGKAKAKARRAGPAPEVAPEVPEAPAPEDPRLAALREAAATVDATVAHLRRLDDDGDRLARGRSDDLPRWEETVYEPAAGATRRAWDRLGELLAESGHSALVAGGRLYFRNAGMPAPPGGYSQWALDVTEHVVPSASVLDLDAAAGGAPPYGFERRLVEALTGGLGWSEVMDRLLLDRRYGWVSDGISRFGSEALHAGRLRVALADA